MDIEKEYPDQKQWEMIAPEEQRKSQYSKIIQLEYSMNQSSFESKNVYSLDVS